MNFGNRKRALLCPERQSKQNALFVDVGLPFAESLSPPTTVNLPKRRGLYLLSAYTNDALHPFLITLCPPAFAVSAAGKVL